MGEEASGREDSKLGILVNFGGSRLKYKRIPNYAGEHTDEPISPSRQAPPDLSMIHWG